MDSDSGYTFPLGKISLNNEAQLDGHSDCVQVWNNGWIASFVIRKLDYCKKNIALLSISLPTTLWRIHTLRTPIAGSWWISWRHLWCVNRTKKGPVHLAFGNLGLKSGRTKYSWLTSWLFLLPFALRIASFLLITLPHACITSLRTVPESRSQGHVVGETFSRSFERTTWSFSFEEKEKRPLHERG